MLKNPFIVYIFSFTLVIGVYQLEWSRLYPNLSWGLLLFFAITFLGSVFFGCGISKIIKKTHTYEFAKRAPLTFILLVTGFAADFIYTGGIPIWLILHHDPYKYTQFGIPTLHVAIITFSGAFSVIRFSDYIYSKRKRYLFEALTPIVYYILILNRGAMLMAITSFFFVLLIRHGKFKIKNWLLAIFFGLILLYGFGVLGNVRTSGIEDVGEPTQAFYDSHVPKSYFWTYIYLTSPIANLEETIKKQKSAEWSFPQFVASEMTPDFISKRILSLLNVDRINIPQISSSFTVSTVYARSYGYADWLGPVMMFIFLSISIVLYLKIIQRSIYRVPCLALLNTLVLFCIFDNMIAFTGMSLQLLWPLLMQKHRTINIIKNS